MTPGGGRTETWVEPTLRPAANASAIVGVCWESANDLRMADAERSSDPRTAAVSFVTTEHFALQSARSATISESTGRATMFLTSVSGGLVALGLVATATRLGTTFFAMALIVLPALAFIGVVTWARVLQSGVEDFGYARRIARLRAYYFDNAPELDAYLLRVPESEWLNVLGLRSGRRQQFVTIAGLVAVITSILAGAAFGVLAAVISDYSLSAALVAGGLVGGLLLAALMRYQDAARSRGGAAPLTDDVDNHNP